MFSFSLFFSLRFFYVYNDFRWKFMNFTKFNVWVKNIIGICFWLLLLNYWFFKIDFLFRFFEKIIFFTKNNCFYLLTGIYIIFIFILLIKRTNILRNLIGLMLFILYIIFYPFLKLLNIIFNFIMKLFFYDSVMDCPR